MITLYLNWNAVCAQKVVLALEEKAVDYAIRHIDLAKFEQHQPWYLKLNPGGVVPTLSWNDHVILESSVINEFIEDQFPNMPLLPREPLARARVRYWGKLVDDVIHPAIRPISFMKIVRPIALRIAKDDLDAIIGRTPKKEIAGLWRRAGRSPYSRSDLAEYLQKIEAVLDKMEAALQSAPYLAGVDYTLADVNITPYFRRLIQLEKSALWDGTRPGVADWLARIQARPSYQIFSDLQARYAH